MFVEATNFGAREREFPLYTSGTVLIGSLLLLFRNYLPGPIRRLAADNVSFTSEGASGEEAGEASADANELEESENMDKNSILFYEFTSHVDRPVPDMFAASVGIIGYVLLSYLIGMLWASPIFTFAYMMWFKIEWYIALIFTILAFVIPYAFMVTIVLPLDSGIWFDGVNLV